MKKWKQGCALLLMAGLLSTSLTGCGLLQRAASAAKDVVAEVVAETEAATETPSATNENTEKPETPAATEQTAVLPERPASGAPVLAKSFTVAYETAPDYGACLVNGRCESPVLADFCAEQYPALATALDAYAKEEIKTYNDTIADLKEQAEMEYQANPDMFQDGMFYTSNVTVLPQRVDEKVVSFFSSTSDFTGGAHGMYGMVGKNFDTQNGKELLLTDVLNDLSDLTERIKTELLANYDPELFNDLDEDLALYDVAVTEMTATADNDMGYVYPYHWALTPTGVAFYFGPYELAAYAAGAQIVTLSYDKNPDLFKPDYLPTGSSGYMVPFEWTLTGYDINGDGKPNTITLDYDYDANYEARLALRMTVDGMGSAATGESLFGTDYDVMGYYVHTGDGRQYIYCTEDMESDFQEWYVFDLNGSEIQYVGETGFKRTVSQEDDGTLRELLLTDPDDMLLAQPFDFLCTFSAVKDYHAGPDGMPVSDEPYFYVYYDCAQEPLVAKTELEYIMLDENGDETKGKGVINPGDSFRVYRTDGEKVLDVTLSDGTLGRLTITSTEYPCQINGLQDEDCVETLWYAG